MDQLPRKKIYGCSLCKQRFSTFHFLKKHMVAHAKKKTFTCSLCHQKFISGVLLDAHTKIHSSGCPYLCALCKKTFPRKSALLKHVISCDAGCKTKNENYHIPFQSATSESKNGNEGTSGILITSGFTAVENSKGSSRKISRNYNFGQSVRGHSSSRKNNDSCTSSRTEKMSFAHYERRHRIVCRLCRRSFKAEHHLGYHHLIAHCKEKPFACPFCSRHFEVKVSLAEHIKWHNRRKKFCQICRKRFTSKKALYKHSKKHSKENPDAKNVVTGKEDCVFCMVCKRKFTNMSTFFKHISCHNKVVWKFDAASQFSSFDEVISQFLPGDETTEQSQMVDTLSGILASDIEDKNNSCSEETQEQEQLPVDSKSVKKDELCSPHLLDIKGDLPVYVRGETHQCSICKKSFKADFHSEYQSQSLLSDEKLYACCLCEEFITKAEIGNHKKQISGGHSTTVTKNPPKNEVKQLCTVVENAKRRLCEELEAVHNPTCQNIIPVKKYDHEGEALELDGDCVCEVCNVSFNMEHSLQKHHLLSHSEEKSFSCDVCQERFVAKCFLTQHMLSHEQLAERIAPLDFSKESARIGDSSTDVATVEDENEKGARVDSNSNNISTVEGENGNAGRVDSNSNIAAVESDNESTGRRESNSNISTVESDNENTSRRYPNSNISSVEGEDKDASRLDSNSNSISTVEGENENASQVDSNSNSNSTVEGEKENASRVDSNSIISTVEGENENAARKDFSSNISVVEAESKNDTRMNSSGNNLTLEVENDATRGDTNGNISTAEDDSEDTAREDSDTNISSVENVTRVNASSDIPTKRYEKENCSGNSNFDISLVEDGNASWGDFSNMFRLLDVKKNISEDEKENTNSDSNSNFPSLKDECGNASRRTSTVEGKNANASRSSFFSDIFTVENEKENGSIIPAEDDEGDYGSLEDFSGNISLLEDEEDSADAGNFSSATTVEVGKFPCNVCKESFPTTDALFEHIPEHCTIRWKLSNHESRLLFFDEMVEKFMSFDGKTTGRLDEMADVSSLSDESTELLVYFDEDTEQYSSAASDSSVSQEDRTKQRMLIEHITSCEGKSREHTSFSNTVNDSTIPLLHAVSRDGALGQLWFDESMEKYTSGEKTCNYTHSDASLTSQHLRAGGVIEESLPYEDSAVVASDKEDSFTCGKRRALCEICNMYFEIDLLQYHYTLIHAKEQPFFCPWCDRNFDAKFLLVEHAEIHMNKFVCSVCDKEFASKLLLDFHCKTHENLQVTPGDSSGKRIPDRCADDKATKCFSKKDIGNIFYRKTCDKEKPVVSHVGYGRDGKNNNHNNFDGVDTDISPMKSSKHTCDTCTKTFKTERLLTKHNLVLHQGKNIYACCVCEERFTVRLFLRKHMKSHLGKDDEKVRAPSEKHFTTKAEFESNQHPLEEYQDLRCLSDSRTDTTANVSAIDLGRHKTPSDHRDLRFPSDSRINATANVSAIDLGRRETPSDHRDLRFPFDSRINTTANVSAIDLGRHETPSDHRGLSCPSDSRTDATANVSAIDLGRHETPSDHQNLSCPSYSRINTTVNVNAVDLCRCETPSDHCMPLKFKADTVTHFDGAQKQINGSNMLKDQIPAVESTLCDRMSSDTTSMSPSNLLHGAPEPLVPNDRSQCLSLCETSRRCSSVDSFSKSLQRSEIGTLEAFGNNSNGQDLTSVISMKAKTSASNKEADSGELVLSLSTEGNRETVSNKEVSKLPDVREDCGVLPMETDTDDSIDSLPDLKESRPKAVSRKKARARNLSRRFRVANKTKQNTCSVCNMVFSERFMLLEHMKIHSSARSLFCSVCNKRYTSKDLFHQHLRNHVSKKQFVNNRKKADTDRSEMDCKGNNDAEKSTTNSGTKKIVCHICKEQVLSRWGLERHKNLYHSINKSYSCIVCKVSFCKAENLIQHIPVHNKIKWVSSVNSIESSFDDAVHKFFECPQSSHTSPSVISSSESSPLKNETKLEVCVVDYLYTRFIEGAKELLDDAGKIPDLSTSVPHEKGERDVNIKDSSLCNTESRCFSLPYESEIQGPCVGTGKDEHQKPDHCGSSLSANHPKRSVGVSSKAEHLKCSASISKSAKHLKSAASDSHEEKSDSGNVEDNFLSDSEMINVLSSTSTQSASRNEFAAKDQENPSDSTILSQPIDEGSVEGNLGSREKLKNKPEVCPRRLSTESGEIGVVYIKVPDKEVLWQSDLKMKRDINEAVDDGSSTSSSNSDADVVYEGIVNKPKYVESSVSSSLQKVNQALTNASLSRKTAQETAPNARRVCPTKLQSQESDIIRAEISDANHYESLVVDKWMIA
ncbi:uncharacterized protein LOC135203490 isoform X1 [Macrobrachium nipponense]|uniref:uncharacterized protein LOC135203490 isoform X1 n=1 Tax=Macrobrachium nipponense TaxID=159736 RepID=UPI0030C8989B